MKENTSNSEGRHSGLFNLDQWLLVWILTAIPIIYIVFTLPKGISQYASTFALSLTLGIILYKFNDYMIPQFKDLLLKAGLCGKDLNKPGALAEKKPM